MIIKMVSMCEYNISIEHRSDLVSFSAQTSRPVVEMLPTQEEKEEEEEEEEEEKEEEEEEVNMDEDNSPFRLAIHWPSATTS